MDYIIENEYLKVTVTTWGAQVKSVIRKCDGAAHIWNADKSVWGYHAPPPRLWPSSPTSSVWCPPSPWRTTPCTTP